MNSLSSNRLPGLDHLRALAITLVFFFHYVILSGGEPSWLPDVAGFGWTGVDLFFALSGYLIASQLFAEIKTAGRLSLSRFYTKRAFRILPAYLAIVVIYFSIPAFREKESLPPLWKFLTFTQNIGLDLRLKGTFSHCWSLCVEEHFYLLLPLTLLALLRWKLFRSAWWLPALLLVGGLAVRWLSYTLLYQPQASSEFSWVSWYQYIYYPTYTRLDGLLAGLTVAAFTHFRPVAWARVSRYGNGLLSAALLCLTGAYFLCDEQSTFNASVWGFPLIALAYGLMVAAAISPACFLSRWNSRVTKTLATLSYAVYLSHKGVIHVTQKLLEGYKLNSNLVLLLCIGTCLTSAFLLHRTVERPFIRLRVALLQKTSNTGNQVEAG